jgi:hypothetical protein
LTPWPVGDSGVLPKTSMDQRCGLIPLALFMREAGWLCQAI